VIGYDKIPLTSDVLAILYKIFRNSSWCQILRFDQNRLLQSLSVCKLDSLSAYRSVCEAKSATFLIGFQKWRFSWFRVAQTPAHTRRVAALLDLCPMRFARILVLWFASSQLFVRGEFHSCDCAALISHCPLLRSSQKLKQSINYLTNHSSCSFTLYSR